MINKGMWKGGMIKRLGGMINWRVREGGYDGIDWYEV